MLKLFIVGLGLVNTNECVKVSRDSMQSFKNVTQITFEKTPLLFFFFLSTDCGENITASSFYLLRVLKGTWHTKTICVLRTSGT